MSLPWKMVKGGASALGLAGVILLLCGCESLSGPPGGTGTAPNESATAVSAQPVGDAGGGGIDELRVGDRITVTFSDIPGAPPPIEQKIREDGKIVLILGLEVTAAGKKAGDLAQEIKEAYVPKYFKRLTVNVKPEERVIYVGGQVRAPNRYIHVGEMTVLRAIKVAGDFTDYAKKTDVQVIRADGSKFKINCKKALKDPKFDVPIYPGDAIHVPQRFW
jgi:protein involved in polysaccharide export with SLBB domain